MTRGSSRSCAVEVTAVTTAAPDVVWDRLIDAWSFADWVSGTVRIRGCDPDWPRPGSSFQHTWGPWPTRIRDRTVVLASEPPLRLELQVYVRPVASLRCRVRLEPAGNGTRVVLAESVERGLATACPPLCRAIQGWRNRRSLRALLRLVEMP